MGSEVGSGELCPPVTTDAVGCCTSEIAGERIRRRVNNTDRYTLTGLLDGIPKVAVVGDNDGGVNVAL